MAGAVEGAIKVRVNAPPAEGKANEECVKVLARFFDVPKRSVRVIAGATSRKKIVEIAGIDAEEVARRIVGL